MRPRAGGVGVGGVAVGVCGVRRHLCVAVAGDRARARDDERRLLLCWRVRRQRGRLVQPAR